MSVIIATSLNNLIHSYVPTITAVTTSHALLYVNTYIAMISKQIL